MIYLYSLLTLIAFVIAIKINRYWKSVVFSPFVLTLLILSSVLFIFNIPFDNYYAGNSPLNYLLSLSIVALALPLYEQVRQIGMHWKEILLVTSFSSVFSMLSGTILALILGGSDEIVASLLPKSVTIPIATVIAESVGGVPSVTAVCVVIAGLQGAIFGHFILQRIGIQHNETQGLAIGSVSHALGTMSCMEKNMISGSYSSIALVLCGIISSIFAPTMFKIVHFFIN